MGTIHVYMSSFFDDRHGRRTGLSRFELGIAGEMTAAGARLVAYSPPRRRLVALDLQRNVAPIVLRQDDGFDRAHGPGREVAFPHAQRLSRALVRTTASLSGRLAPHLSAMLLAPPATIETGDILLVPGIVWSGAALDELRRLRRQHRIRIVPFIHDLIPVRRPEFHTDEVGVFRFRRYAETMAEIADWVCVSSSFVAADVRAFLAEQGHPEIPVHEIPLCPDITRRTTPLSTPRLDALALEPDGFALYVSTLNVRKNHAWLYEIWRRLATSSPETTMPLVIAGQRGWGVSDLIRRMTTDPAMWGRFLHFVEAPTDAEVARLYESCAFTVFPSHFEGWGLGVTESLEFGKPCIAADNSALAEAGQGLAIHIDLLDGLGWSSAIRRMSEDRAWRHELSADIRRAYRPRTWQDVGRDMLRALAKDQY